MTDDAQRARLDRVAGISRRTPLTEYVVDDLSFGAARLRRHPGNGRWESLSLALTPEFAAACEAAGGSRATSVHYPMEHWLAQGAVIGERGEVPAGLHALLVDEALLSHPEWLVTATATPLASAAATTLAGLRAGLARATDIDATCPVCPMRRGGRRRRSVFGPGGRMDRAEAAMLGLLNVAPPDDPLDAPPPEPECPHTMPRREALRALYAEFPELAFEAASVLVAAPSVAPPRFVLSAMVMKALLESWLMNRGSDHYIGPYATRPVVWPGGGPAADALALATQSWGYAAPPAEAPPGDDEMPMLSTAATLPDVALVWPEVGSAPATGVVEAPAPRRAKKPAAPRKKKA